MGWDLSAWRFVIWNVFLAVIPVLTAYVIWFGVSHLSLTRRLVPWPVWLPLMAVWFVFLPNTCYLLTEWRHFLFDDPMPEMIRRADTDRSAMLGIAKWGLFFLVYSGIGAASFVLSIRPIHGILKRVRIAGWVPGVPFFLLTSFGVYLGLIVRLNSWDILHRPGYVWDSSMQALSNGTLMKVVVIFAVLLWLLYWVGDVWVDGFVMRVTRYRRGRHSGRLNPRQQPH